MHCRTCAEIKFVDIYKLRRRVLSALRTYMHIESLLDCKVIKNIYFLCLRPLICMVYMQTLAHP
jgi:hypothetical protein